MSSEHGESDPDQAVPRRVGRPPRLAASQVVDAAIELGDQMGLEELSMPKLARHLGVGTMTLYGYVESKQDLLDKMAARIFEGLAAPSNDDWQQALTVFFSDFREAALAHPTLAGLLATGRVTIPAVFEILEAFFQKTTAHGVPIDEAVRTFYAGLTYTIGFVLWEIPRAHLQPEAAYAEQWAGLISRLDPTRYPLLSGPAATAVPTVASPPQFEWGLNKIISG